MKVFIGRYPKSLKAERKVNIRIDKWDTWSMDHTLAMIILPMLKQLQATKHGAPGSMPAFQQTSNQYPQMCFTFYEDDDHSAWNEGHKQWTEIMDKMIWSFEQLLDENWDEQFWIVKPELDLDDLANTEGLDENGCKELKWKVEGECDWKAREEYANRIKEGLELFGKYYQDLWD